MFNRIIIFGGHIQALGLARQANKEGLEVTLLIKDRWSIAKYSNSVKEIISCTAKSKIYSTISPFASKGTLLFPTSDEYVEYIADNYEILSKEFSIGIPEPSCVNIFSNKRTTYKFCEEHGIPHPKSYYPNSLDEVVLLSSSITYPTVIKPAVMYSFHDKFGKKAILCRNRDELITKCHEIERSNYSIENLIIQEFLSGGAKDLYSFGTYCKKGTPVAWIQANRIRQNPMDFGNSTTFAITCYIPQIEEAARRILRLTNYSGLAEVEFMYDEKSNEYKFLEINTRAWKWHSISENFGFGFLSELIRNSNSLNSNFEPINERKAWVERLTDWTIIIKETLKGKMNFVKAIKTYFIRKKSAVWSWKDPIPAIMYIIMAPVLYFKRHKI